MNSALLDYLACPICRGAITLHSVFVTLTSGAVPESIKEGVLRCDTCGELYPIIEETPRMLPPESLTDEEKDFLRAPPAVCRELSRPRLSEAERQAKIEEAAKEHFAPPAAASAYSRARMEHWTDYQSEKTEKKEKVLFTIYPFLREEPLAIADIGGGQGGLITCLRRFLKPKIAIVLDYDLGWIEVGRLRDPQVEFVRGDATRLPLGDTSVDLLVTMATLEHIPDWERAVHEMARVCQILFLSYNPNRYCLFDRGHLDAPVLPFLPETLTCQISYLWHKVRRTGRAYESIVSEYRRTQYISRHRVQALLQRYGRTTNAWNDFVFHSVRSDYHYWAGRTKRFLRKHYVIQALFSVVAEALGIEPNVYLILQRH